MIVPTGIGASIGGFAGDALPSARLLASAVDNLVTHPNVMNGAMVYWPIPNALYVEGFALDRFAAGEWALRPSRPTRSNRIGLVLDRAIKEDMRIRHLQVADAMRASLGIDVSGYAVTDKPLEVELSMTADGTSWGTLGNPDSLIACARSLVEKGCTAIAVVAVFPEEDEDHLQAYREGSAVDAIAGAEAIISHLVTRELEVPCAHAPCLQPLDASEDVSPKAAAEELGYTFLPCVLAGLSNAPQIQICSTLSSKTPSVLTAGGVNAVIVPKTACGGSGVLSLVASGAKLITVGNNTTSIDVTPESLGLPAIEVSNYLEAAGVLLADRNGILGAALDPKIRRIPNIGQ
ncbi:hypothetical protein NDN08_005773 [Rhodosorus marinus]|uniref:DUF3326 domain-containing protein n=1 Tax=Rhodosorus marinus TaxID=101924 RepID=A0AAV8V4B2_9RHOD|nr:hypothetical protein NDN08_005773 [Rhodosorus marinus]